MQKKMIWPVPRAYSRKIPSNADAAFAAPREYKYGKGKHCGIDIFTPIGSKVLAIGDGIVVHVSDFTGKPWSPQWRRSWYVMVENRDKRVAAYCELRKPKLKKGQEVTTGQIIGYTAKVLFGKKTRESSVLHFELRKPRSRVSTDWYKKKPERILDPTKYLKSIL